PLITKTGEPGGDFGAESFAAPEEAPARRTVTTSAARSVVRGMSQWFSAPEAGVLRGPTQGKLRLSHRSEGGTPSLQEVQKGPAIERFLTFALRLWKGRGPDELSGRLAATSVSPANADRLRRAGRDF